MKSILPRSMASDVATGDRAIFATGSLEWLTRYRSSCRVLR
jgi:hypothetical protein